MKKYRSNKSDICKKTQLPADQKTMTSPESLNAQKLYGNKILNVLKTLRCSWITAWLIAISIIFAVTVSYAAYMGVKTSKRVISLSDRDSMLFSSRYMAVGETSVQEEGVPTGTTDPAIIVNVVNSDRAGMGVYGSTIHFKFKARLVDRETGNSLEADPNVSGYTVYYYSGSSDLDTPKPLTLTNSWLYFGTSEATASKDNAYTFDLPGGVLTNRYFDVHFPASELVSPTYAVEISAEATDGYDDIKDIKGKIAVAARSSTSVEWSGEFADNQTGRTPADYDAYNYTISGAGKGTVTLSYDTNYVVLDKNDKAGFKSLAGAAVNEPTENNSTATISFPVDTTVENAISYYSIRFYRAGKLDEDGKEKVMNGFSDAYIKTVFKPDSSD